MKPEEITPDTFPKYTPNPNLVGLPDYLKDPANFEKIQRELLDALATTHSHSDLFEWSTCPNCQHKLKAHRELMRKLGFKNGKQYMDWKKTHEEIKKRMPLMDWKKGKPLT